MELGLRDKSIVITGATASLARAIAIDFSLEGATVSLCSKDEKKIKSIQEEILSSGRKALSFVLDENDKKQVAITLDLIKKEIGYIDILINNFNYTDFLKPFESVEEEEWTKILTLNLYGIFHFIKYSITFLKESKNGKIINISSIVAREPGINMAYYNLCNSAVINLTKSLSKELAVYKILVNSVSAGAIDIPEWNKVIKDLSYNLGISSEDIKNIFTSNFIPLKRVARAEEISPLIVFLASDKASYITGANINIDGGASNSI